MNGPSRRILVVDDNRDSADSMAMLLRLHGHDVPVAHDAQRAIELAAEMEPAVVLLDIGLPEMEAGFDAHTVKPVAIEDIATLLAAPRGSRHRDRPQPATT